MAIRWVLKPPTTKCFILFGCQLVPFIEAIKNKTDDFPNVYLAHE